MRKEIAIRILENAVKQQELCNKLMYAIDAEVNDNQTEMDVYVEMLTGMAYDTTDYAIWEPMTDIIFNTIDREELTHYERAEIIYDELSKRKQPDTAQVYELNGTLRMVG